MNRMEYDGIILSVGLWMTMGCSWLFMVSVCQCVHGSLQIIPRGVASVRDMCAIVHASSNFHAQVIMLHERGQSSFFS